MKKLHLNKKESWRKEIFWLRSPFVTCQYPEGFCWLTSHPKPRVGKLKRDKFGSVLISTFFRGSKSIKNRYRFFTIWLVGLEEEIIDKDFTQSYCWLCNFWLQPNRIFTVAVPQASHGTIAMVIFSRVKITCYFHLWRYHVFSWKLNFIGVYVIILWYPRTQKLFVWKCYYLFDHINKNKEG